VRLASPIVSATAAIVSSQRASIVSALHRDPPRPVTSKPRRSHRYLPVAVPQAASRTSHRPFAVKGLIPSISTNQFKNGNHIEVEGTVFKILEFQHVKPGKGGAFVRTKLRRAADGAVIDRTFRAGEKFRPVRTEARKMQFLYADGTDAHFMDSESFEQLPIPESKVGETLKWVKPNEDVDLLFIDGAPTDIQLSASVELEVTHTEPGVKGDTASGGGNKPATLETGAVVNVPLFVNIGDRIKVDTRSGSYMSRA
jgi:elongation factor P